MAADISRYHIQSISVDAAPASVPLQRMLAGNHVGSFASSPFLFLSSMFANRTAGETGLLQEALRALCLKRSICPASLTSSVGEGVENSRETSE